MFSKRKPLRAFNRFDAGFLHVLAGDRCNSNRYVLYICRDLGRKDDYFFDYRPVFLGCRRHAKAYDRGTKRSGAKCFLNIANWTVMASFPLI